MQFQRHSSSCPIALVACLVTALATFGGHVATAEEIHTYSSDVVFNTGYDEFYVSIIENAHLTVLDGRAGNSIWMNDTATADLYGGWVNSLGLYENNVANMYS